MINDIHYPRIRGGNASSTVSRHYFLQMATNIIDDADDIANFNGKILSWMYMDLPRIGQYDDHTLRYFTRHARPRLRLFVHFPTSGWGASFF